MQSHKNDTTYKMGIDIGSTTVKVVLADEEKDFIEKAKENRFIGVNGHRLVGGCRISLYNAVTIDACKAVAQFMEAYRKEHQ